jgi:hypothetical protein
MSKHDKSLVPPPFDSYLPLDCHVAVDAINQDGLPSALGGNGDGGSNGADGEDIRIIQMHDSKWQEIGNRTH